MHHKNIEDVIRELRTSLNGLTEKDAVNRVKAFGLNEIKEAKKYLR